MKTTKESASTDLLINIDDFKSMKLQISIENLTTRTSVFKDRKIFPKGKDEIIQAGDFPIELFELKEEGFVLEIPAKVCSKGHTVKVTIETMNKGPDERFTFLTKVIDIKEDKALQPEKASRGADARQVFEFVIDEDDLSKLPRFEKMFAKKQDEALELFETLRGR